MARYKTEPCINGGRRHSWWKLGLDECPNGEIRRLRRCSWCGKIRTEKN